MPWDKEHECMPVEEIQKLQVERLRETVAWVNEHVPFYREKFGYRPGDFPITEALSARTIALPFHNHLSEADVDYVLERRRGMTQEEVSPPPLINGADLTARGYAPGPAFGEVLSGVRERQLDGEIKTREEALQAAEEIAARIGAPKR